MIVAVGLAMYASLASVAGGRMVDRQRWLDVSPRAAVVVWFATVWSAIASAVSAAVIVALHSWSVRDTLLDLVAACMMSFHQHYAQLGMGSAAALVFLGFGLLWVVVRSLREAQRVHDIRRRQHLLLNFLGVVARRGRVRVTVVAHPSPSVYCLPGHGGRIVVTDAATAQLTSGELEAVLHHEDAHLRGRHHWITGAAGCLRAALPFVPLVCQAQAALSFLVERLADERASRAVGPGPLLSAMVTVAGAGTPAATLGMGGPSVARRAELLQTGRGNGLARALVSAGLVAALVLTPLALGGASAAALDWNHHCLMVTGA